MDLAKFDKLRKRAQQLASARDQAKGAVTQLLEQLKTEFGCDSLEVGEQEHARMEIERRELDRKAEKLMEAFETKWGDKLQ